jgi:hypothetical protein
MCDLKYRGHEKLITMDSISLENQKEFNAVRTRVENVFAEIKRFNILQSK